MFAAFDISTSALMAQRTRLNAISSNLANMSTTRNEAGELSPYKARYVTFEADSKLKSSGGGVGVRVGQVGQSSAPPEMKYQPGHPDANEKGFVAYPAIDMTRQFVDALEATRAYEANIGVLEITKDLGQQTLRIVA